MSHYKLLPSNETFEDGRERQLSRYPPVTVQTRIVSSRADLRKSLCIGSIVLNLVLLSHVAFNFLAHPSHSSWLTTSLKDQCSCPSVTNPWVDTKSTLTYFSSAEAHVGYEIVNALSAFDVTEYDGPPTDEIDALWKDLYDARGMSGIPRSEAKMMQNDTVRVPGEEQHYIVSLDVFHQLHCLNHIRKALHPERYGDVIGQGHFDIFDHVDHCISSLRRSLMCNSDLAMNVWQWKPHVNGNEGMSLPHLEVPHKCRKWDDVIRWSDEHRLTVTFNGSLYVPDL